MKAYLSFFVWMTLAATTASAQIAFHSQRQHVEEKYNSLYLQYNPQTIHLSGGSKSGANGYLLGYTVGRALSSSVPVYLEAGLAFQYAKYEDSDMRLDFVDGRIPLNIAYCIQIPNTIVILTPYVGLSVKLNIAGVVMMDKNIVNKVFNCPNAERLIGDDYYASLFNPRYYYTRDAAKRFQLAYQVGLNVGFDRMYVGIGYGKDLTEYMDYPPYFPKMKFGSLNVTLGIHL